jgi:DNA repair protein RadA
LDSKTILQNIRIAKPKDSKEQESCIEYTCSNIVKSDSKIKLLIVDSLMFHYRREYPERRNLSERTHRINKYMYKLLDVARASKVAVVITNHITSNPTTTTSDFYEPEYSQPFGGNIVFYTSTYVVNLKRIKMSSIQAILVKSPLARSKACYLQIYEGGFIS